MSFGIEVIREYLDPSTVEYLDLEIEALCYKVIIH